MQESDLKEFCELGRKETAFMKKIYEKQNLSPRRYHKILKTARTIADVRGSNEIEVSHLFGGTWIYEFLNWKNGE